MKSRHERLQEYLASISDERLDAIDARLADPNDPVRTRKVEWRDDPDPFGMNWEWLGGGQGDEPRQ